MEGIKRAIEAFDGGPTQAAVAFAVAYARKWPTEARLRWLRPNGKRERFEYPEDDDGLAECFANLETPMDW